MSKKTCLKHLKNTEHCPYLTTEDGSDVCAAQPHFGRPLSLNEFLEFCHHNWISCVSYHYTLAPWPETKRFQEEFRQLQKGLRLVKIEKYGVLQNAEGMEKSTGG